MFWVNIAILPLLAACAGAQSTDNPVTPNSIQTQAESEALNDVNNEMNDTGGAGSGHVPNWLHDYALKCPELLDKYFSSLGISDLWNAENVCVDWEPVANWELKKRCARTIIHIDLHRGFTNESVEMLMHCDHSSRKLLILFQSETVGIPMSNSSNCKEWFYLVRNLPVAAGECFVVKSIGLLMNRLTLHSGHPNDRLVVASESRSDIYGFILPEDLLRKFDIAVVYPDLRLFRSRRPLFNGPAESNKKLFARFFGWKESAPIKVALIFSRQIKDDVDSWNINGDKQRAREVARWLKSLPERENMLVFDFFDPFPAQNRDAIGIGKDLAVLLFGGKTMLVEYSALQSGGERIASSGFLEASKTHLEEWKADVIDKWPQPVQKIAFVIFEAGFRKTMEVFRDVFGDDVKVVMLPRFSTTRPLQMQFASTFIFIGFPGT